MPKARKARSKAPLSPVTNKASQEQGDDCRSGAPTLPKAMPPPGHPQEEAVVYWIGIHGDLFMDESLGKAQGARRLDGLGRPIVPKTYISWDDMFHRLVVYRAEHGHVDVPRAENKRLGEWVALQRRTLTNAPLDNERRQRLDSIGFTWNGFMSHWLEMFRRLVAYKEQHGDCDVPLKYPPDKSLGLWVKRQREQLKNAPTDDERRTKLESIQFSWSL